MKKKSIIISISIIILLVGFIWMYSNVLAPSYRSYLSSCEPAKFNETYGDKYSVGGQVTIEKQFIPKTNETIEKRKLEIFVDREDIIKHEIIHLNQAESDRIFSCNYKYLRISNEAEAYLFENLPTPIFKIFYDDYGLI